MLARMLELERVRNWSVEKRVGAWVQDKPRISSTQCTQACTSSHLLGG